MPNNNKTFKNTKATVNLAAKITSGEETDSAVFENKKLNPKITFANNAHKTPVVVLFFAMKASPFLKFATNFSIKWI